MLRALKRSLASVLLVGLVVFSGYFVLVQKCLNQVLQIPEAGMVLHIDEGSNLSRLSASLEQQGIIYGRRLLLLHARINELNTIHAGEYRLEPGETLAQLIEKLAGGDVIYYQITFPEGLTLKQWLKIIEQHPQFSGHPDMQSADSSRYLNQQVEQLKATYSLTSVEGWLLPETYRFSGADTVFGILSRAHENMREVLENEWEQRPVGLPYENPYEALIMASIVEKETGKASERQQIAGVFVRRMEKGMKLQTDPTVIYGLGSSYNGNLTRRDLRSKTAYNTYMIKGLPPTPIAMPGRAAIHAALNPDDSDTLFFVAKGDGSHEFSTSLEDHVQAVRQYQLQRRSDYRSSPNE
ncbi:MAG: endolytic transglycosylase MltG [Porticoccaceae bacterium]|nr:endolytic transglycosylase MltG [Pseudomonadales bacterium]MCP5171580.1 endolytic transglycosylase MltG [Pseudomonadales bacterium]